MTPEQKAERNSNIHTARVYLREAAARRTFHGMHANLLAWAGNARRRAMAAMVVEQPAQGELAL